MRRIGRGRCFAALLCMAALVMTGCAAVQQAIPTPSARVDAVDIESVTLSDLTLRFDIEVENPYGSPLPVLGLNYDISTSGRDVIEGWVKASESIPAGETRILPMSTKIPFEALVTAVETIRPGTTIPYEAKLGLEVDAPLLGGVEVPMRKEGEVRIPLLP